MGRLALHRGEYDRLWVRLLTMSLMVCLFGAFSAILLWMIGVESLALTPAQYTSGSWEWSRETINRELPLAAAYVIVPGLMALAVGRHTIHLGGILGFLVGLFNLLPLYLAPPSHLENVLASPTIWCSVMLGLLIAFYIGDVGSWLCRRQLVQEALEDDIDDRGPPQPIRVRIRR